MRTSSDVTKNSKHSKNSTDGLMPSESLDLPANQYGDPGTYSVTIGIGTPKHDVSLMFDTGSDLTWTQCEPCRETCYPQDEPKFNPSSSSSYSNVPCSSPISNYLVSAGLGSASNSIYKITYGDNSWSRGFLAEERFTLTSSDVFDSLNFGCGSQSKGKFAGVAGVLGLGRGELSFPSQTAKTYNKIFSYCLPSSCSYTGHLTFGSAAIPPSVKFTPFSTIPDPSFYGLDIEGISVGNRKLSIPLTVFSTHGAIIDSGTVITRLPPKAYAALRAEFKNQMMKFNYKTSKPYSNILDTCYDLTGLETVSFPKISFHFRGGAVVEVGSTGVIYPTQKSQVCLAFAANKKKDKCAIFGNVQQRTLEILYDGAGGRIGFAPNGCR